MKTIRLKTEQRCHRCNEKLHIGVVAIKESFKTKDNKWFFLYYHEVCFLWMIEEKVKRNRAELQAKEEIVKFKRPRGGKRKYKDTVKSLNIKSSIRYHKKRGNDQRVAELEEELAGLLIQY